MPGEVFGFVLGLGVDDRELLADRGLERTERGGVELDVGVVVDDELFDPVDMHGFASAVGELGVPAGADEVGVDDIVLVLRVSQQQPRVAVVAVQRLLEVVVVDLGLVAGEVVRPEHGLDLVPHVDGHEGFVGRVVLEPLVDDDALVVGARAQRCAISDRGARLLKVTSHGTLGGWLQPAHAGPGVAVLLLSSPIAYVIACPQKRPIHRRTGPPRDGSPSPRFAGSPTPRSRGGQQTIDNEVGCVDAGLAAVSGYGVLEPLLNGPEIEEVWLKCPRDVSAVTTRSAQVMRRSPRRR